MADTMTNDHPARVTAVLTAGTWEGRPETDRVLIDFDRRFRRRFLLHSLADRHILLDLPQAVRLRDGDGLEMGDGGIVRVCARPEPLVEITAPDHAALMRIAWHLGNRHLPVQFIGERIRIRQDHVIADMVLGLGGQAQQLEAPFDPEAGAYAGAGGHHHAHDDDGHDHHHHEH
jgi:urease accessory protein